MKARIDKLAVYDHYGNALNIILDDSTVSLEVAGQFSIDPIDVDTFCDMLLVLKEHAEGGVVSLDKLPKAEGGAK